VLASLRSFVCLRIRKIPTELREAVDADNTNTRGKSSKGKHNFDEVELSVIFQYDD
jgi:hypothetical protein